MKLFLTILFLVVSSTCRAEEVEIGSSTVKWVDLPRCMGKWYEIGRYPHWFEKGLCAVAATYSFDNDGISMVITGRKDSIDGPEKQAFGRVWVLDKETNATIKTVFYWFFRYTFIILELDDDYQYAVIGDPKRKYLWILSRKPNMDDDTYEKLLNKVKLQGYDTGLIKITEQLPEKP